MRIAVVNDAPSVLEVLRRILSTADGVDVAWTARDGLEAAEKCMADTPDLVLMDIFMPVMDGIASTRLIMQQSPCAILLVTANVKQSASQVFEAMGAGALDAINVPVLGTDAGAEDGAARLLAKIAIIGKLIGGTKSAKSSSNTPGAQSFDRAAIPLVLIGASTGGPQALATILRSLPADFPACVALVQHVDDAFVNSLADWLQKQCALPVRLAESGERPQPGTVILPKGCEHLYITPKGRFAYTGEPADSPFHPSVDVLFKSAATFWTGPGVGVLLTGMGRDGAAGLLALRTAGWRTVAQTRDSCAVYGMPKAAVELDAVDELLSPIDIGRLLCTAPWKFAGNHAT